MQGDARSTTTSPYLWRGVRYPETRIATGLTGSRRIVVELRNIEMLKTIFTRWQNVVDFLVLATAIYWLLIWGKKTHALRIVVGIGGLVALGSLAQRLGLPITAWVMHLAALTSVVLLVLVYYSEIRYALTQLDPFSRLMRPRPPVRIRTWPPSRRPPFLWRGAPRGDHRAQGNDQLDHLLVGGISSRRADLKEILEAIFPRALAGT